MHKQTHTCMHTYTHTYRPAVYACYSSYSKPPTQTAASHRYPRTYTHTHIHIHTHTCCACILFIIFLTTNANCCISSISTSRGNSLNLSLNSAKIEFKFSVLTTMAGTNVQPPLEPPLAFADVVKFGDRRVREARRRS
jgi:hypothetical protein